MHDESFTMVTPFSRRLESVKINDYVLREFEYFYSSLSLPDSSMEILTVTPSSREIQIDTVMNYFEYE